MTNKPYPVYACLGTLPSSDYLILATTYKPYFDHQQVMDDGRSDEIWPRLVPYTSIMDRLDSTGALFEFAESYFETNLKNTANIAETKDMLIKLAAKSGVSLIFNHQPFDRQTRLQT